MKTTELSMNIANNATTKVLAFKGMHNVGYVYACEYTGGLVKIGMTSKKPKDRIRCHDHTMLLAGRKRVDCYISKKIAAPRDIESKVIHHFEERYKQKSREWFLGACLNEVKQIVERFSMSADHPDAVKAREQILERMDRAGSGFLVDPYDPNFGTSQIERNKTERFARCMDLAERMEQVLRVGPAQDHEDLDTVDRTGYAPCSQFRLMAAVTLFKSQDNHWRHLFSASVNDPAGLIGLVGNVMRHWARKEGMMK